MGRAMTRGTGRPPKYAPLAAHLAAQPDDVARVELTFAEVEAILGARLPPTAVRPIWWSNSMSSPQGRAWLAAGWRATPRVGGRRVIFTRAEGDER